MPEIDPPNSQPEGVPCQLRRRGEPREDVPLSLGRVSKGQHWWHKANHRFFRELTQTELRELHRRITGDELLALKYPARVLQNYLQEELAPLHPVLTNGHLLHVLFHHAEGKQEINHIASFAFRQYSSARDNPEMTLSQGLRLDSLRIPPEEIAAEPPS